MLRLSFLLVVLSSSAVLAAGPLEAADKAFEALEFEQAAELYSESLTQPAPLSDRIRAYKGLALSQAFMGESKSARLSFVKLLMMDPAATVDESMGPKITGPFNAARKQRKSAAIDLDRDADSGEVTVTLREDVSLAKTLAVSIRNEESRNYNRTVGPANRPLAVATDPRSELDVFVQAFDANDGVVYAKGSAQAPLRLQTRLPKPSLPEDSVAAVEDPFVPKAPRVTKSNKPFPTWPIWVGVGVAVVAAGVGAYALVKRPAPLNLPEADSTIELPLHAAF